MLWDESRDNKGNGFGAGDELAWGLRKVSREDRAVKVWVVIQTKCWPALSANGVIMSGGKTLESFPRGGLGRP